MPTRLSDTQRALLRALADAPVSGPALADDLGVSRAAIWKAVEGLRDQGFDIESTGSGYEITTVPDYGAGAIEFELDAPYAIEFHESLGSTNDRAREIATGEGADGSRGGTDGSRDGTGGSRDGAAGVAENIVVVADEQTGGRGRLDRPWTAPAGGVWLSAVLAPDRPPAHVPLFTLAAAVATTRACREAGVDAGIKWPNDVLVESDDGERGGLKLAGILTEMEGEADRVSWLVVGIGVNANVDAADLPAGATSLRSQRGSDVDRRLFVQRLLEEFHALGESPEEVLPAWRAHATTIGRRVRVDTPSGVVEGEAVDVVHPGALVIRTESGDVTVHAGDCDHLRPA